MLYEELKEKLKRLDEVSLLQLLDISSEDLVNRFDDLIEEMYEEQRTTLIEAVEEEYDEEQ